ncbi:chemotaxis protein MotB [Desulfacinum hydrothermale DSM 13146]|uniref:Chemotaxis protein MotB n=1 Tax=Desulfacinum hydrothermale DSM 13146 TaxID=1121390 RepID=A0A1W1X6B3_9BACT|nr:OmpA family protein [Desulfacinum hydrothermale]SMC19390.1 chemotaxis protein MotB [Desulfacinum hydrothermale DSM 13146]
MAKKKKGGGDEGGEGSASWMVTFSDLSTLLLTFFVLLLSMSSLNDKAIRSTFQNFDKSSGILFFKNRQKVRLNSEMAVKDIVKSLKSVYLMDVRDLDEVTKVPMDKNLKLVISSGNALFVKKRWAPGSFSFIFGDQLLFESGRAELKPKAYKALEKFAVFLRQAPYRVYVDGHTDSRPVSGRRFASNDELSLARAMAVARFFVDKARVPPEKVAVGAYGDTQPLMPNTTPEGRRMNRRVELIFEQVS